LILRGAADKTAQRLGVRRDGGGRPAPVC